MSPAGVSPARIVTLARHELRYFARVPVPLLIYLAMPIVLMAFLHEAFGRFFGALGYTAELGASFVVTSQVVMFGYLFTEHCGLWIYSEHQWRTWNRVRATAATGAEVVIGKGVVWVTAMMCQTVILLGMGGVIFGLTVRGPWIVFGAMLVANLACTLAFAFAGVALCRTTALFDAWCYGGGLLLAALGGALTPSDLLPSWARQLGRASPVSWSIDGLRAVQLDGKEWSAVAGDLAALALFTAGFAVIAMVAWNPRQSRTGRTR